MLYYIHGYLSNPKSTKGKLFKKKLEAIPIKYRDCKPEEIVISDCLEQIKKVIEKDKEIILIGSSFGGFLAAKTALENKNVKQIILLNPAIIPPYVDISKIKQMPKKLLRDMQDKNLFNKKINTIISIFVGIKDELIPSDWPIEFALSQDATIKFLYDDHSFTNNINQLPEIIGKILYKNIKR
jgi:pimeloyl-ACP methyl ester carboxylesterase